MYTCSDCDLRFDEAHQAFAHLCLDHDNASEETKTRLEAMFEWQMLHYESVSLTQSNNWLDEAAELKGLRGEAPVTSPEGSIAL